MALSHISLKSAWRWRWKSGGVRGSFIYTDQSVGKLNPHLKFRNCAVLIVYNLVFHGAEVHRMLDNC